MFKLRTVPGHPESLKACIAVHLGRNALVIENVEDSSDPPAGEFNGRIPLITIKSAEISRNLNDAISLLWTDDWIHVRSVTIWLDWESSFLKPAIQAYLVLLQKKQSNDIVESYLFDLLQTLNSQLEGKAQCCVVGDCLTPADVSIWSTLYPLFGKDNDRDYLVSKFPLIQRWFSTTRALNAFQKAEEDFTHSKNLSWHDLLSLATYDSSPLPPDIQARWGDSQQNSSSSKALENYPDEEISEADLEEIVQFWACDLSHLPKPIPRTHPVLPETGKRNILITSALPYVNNVPHLGNIIGCVLSADVFSRYCRLRGYNCLYVCGTDEYGTATETKALEERVTPREICDRYNQIHTDIYRWFNIDFDYFGRTTTEQQTKIAQDIFWSLNRNGFLLEETMTQLHCPRCSRFLADRFVEGICPHPGCGYEDARGDQCDKCGKLVNAEELRSPRCKLCKAEPEKKDSRHLFLDLPKIEESLEKWIDSVSSDWTSNALGIAKSWLREGLKPRCITRDLQWGTPVPKKGFQDKVFYVWYDAPIGYLSITANYTDKWDLWWNNPEMVTLYQFMAKDNVPFHAIIFPACQLGTGKSYTMVNHLISTEYLNYEDDKFSKSRGVGVFGDHAKNTNIDADVWRFYLLAIRPETQDSAFAWEDFLLRANSELLNNLGNYVNRSLVFLKISRTIQKQLNVPPEANIILDSFVAFLRPGHRIGEPSPIFRKLEVAEMAELRQRFAGTASKSTPQQQSQVSDLTTGLKDINLSGGGTRERETEIVALEGAIADQGNIVRELKAKKADKSLIDSEVAKLLALKKNLASLTVCMLELVSDPFCYTFNPHRLISQHFHPSGFADELTAKVCFSDQVRWSLCPESVLFELRFLVIMSEQGAKLQRLNNDLVKVIESLRGQRDDLRQERDSIANQKRKVEAQLVLLAGEARELDKRLKESNAALGTVEDAIRDAEQSYSKLTSVITSTLRNERPYMV
ncbi:unnamed protein product [Cyprideis torosa]|uniref:Methionine--tRNA ligase, cytoplasmic n=1 Tax=Cyprideis torosa TaxID=163714 RepID=A0A7R8W2X4_9CRUS|nr:unnamed protein product [Cyprideis torosa]CAG0880180.1 unnamed protein product [Cyprideis torosa]